MASSRPRSVLATAGAMHFVHDGFSEILYVLLPVWAAEFRLSLWQVGFIRSAYTGGMAAFQIPAGLLAERFGERRLLMLGTLVTACAFIGVAAGATDFVPLLLLLTLAGLGSGVQHPLSSSVVAKAYEDGPRRAALGTYNFAGDIGKMSVPAAAALLLTLMTWQPAVMLLGAVGVAAAVAIFVLTPRYGPEPAIEAKTTDDGAAAAPVAVSRIAFPVLLSIGVIDSAIRMAFLTFLPFLLIAKGASLPTVGLALTLVFAGGAAGKLVCAFIGARIGTVATVWLTEGLTAVTILALLPLPLEAGMLLLPVIGVALNGTSSVLYGSVPDLVTSERRTRAFSIFYTGSIGAGALAPALFGIVGDIVGITAALVVVACMVLLTLPLALILKPFLPARVA
jgi:MFS transporter, FSR family, fosmidomycin resistance protein